MHWIDIVDWAVVGMVRLRAQVAESQPHTNQHHITTDMQNVGIKS